MMFATKIHQARRAAGLSQQGAANAIGVGLRTYKRWEARDCCPSWDMGQDALHRISRPSADQPAARLGTQNPHRWCP